MAVRSPRAEDSLTFDCITRRNADLEGKLLTRTKRAPGVPYVRLFGVGLPRPRTPHVYDAYCLHL